MLEAIEQFLSMHMELVDKITMLIILAFVLIPALKKDQIKLKNKWRKEWEEEQKKASTSQNTKFMTQAEFEKWKAEREKETFKDQGGYLDLDAIAALFRRKTAPELFKDKRPDHQRKSREP